MLSEIGTRAHHLFDPGVDAVKSGVRRIIERAEPAKLRVASSKVTDLIKANPVTSVAIAFVAGYVVIRAAERWLRPSARLAPPPETGAADSLS